MNILFGDNRMQNSGNWKKGVSNLCFQEAWLTDNVVRHKYSMMQIKKKMNYAKMLGLPRSTPLNVRNTPYQHDPEV
jgi:hypothetical protein